MLFSFVAAELVVAAAAECFVFFEARLNSDHPSAVLFVKSDKSQSAQAVLDDIVVDNFADMLQDEVDSESLVDSELLVVVFVV